MTPSQLYYGSTPVPYVAAWTGEDTLFLGPCPYSRQSGLNAIRQVQARGVGKPTFGKPHMDRQREAIARDLCDLCGKALKNRTKVSLSQARPQPHAANPGDVISAGAWTSACRAFAEFWRKSLGGSKAGFPGADFSSDVGGGWGTDTLPGGQGGFEKTGKITHAEFARALHELTVAGLAEPGDMPLNRDIVRRIGHHQPGPLAPHQLVIAGMIQRIAAKQPVAA